MKTFTLRNVFGRWSVLALMGLATAAGLKAHAVDAEHGEAALERTETLSIEDARPVAAAVRYLNERFGYQITYEDPRYAYSGDLKDVTSEVRTDSKEFASGRAPKVLVPSVGKMSFDLKIAKTTERPRDAVSVVQSLLQTYAAKPAAAVFRLESSNDGFIHVMPALVRDATGQWTNQTSLLATPISVTGNDLNSYQMIESICDALSSATGMRVETGTFPVNALVSYRGDLDLHNVTARDALTKVLRDTGRALTWNLSYSPGLRWYLLNLSLVPEVDSKPTRDPPVAPRPSEGSMTGTPSTKPNTRP